MRVQGRTELVGGAITSTQTAIDAGRNAFDSAGGVSATDITNTASYSGRAFSIQRGAQQLQTGEYQPAGNSAGIGSVGDSASSVTRSGISGYTEGGDGGLRTGDQQVALAPLFNPERAQADLHAQVTITQAALPQVASQIARHADGQLGRAQGLRELAEQERDPQRAAHMLTQAEALEGLWGETGPARVLAHAVAAGLTGGVDGVLGLVSGAAAAPLMRQLNELAGLDGALADTLVGLAASAAGAAVGGATGAAAAFNEVHNNYLTPRENAAYQNARAACLSGEDAACTVSGVLAQVDQSREAQLTRLAQACNDGDMSQCLSLTRTLNQWRAQGDQELQALQADLWSGGQAGLTSCAPPRDCSQARNWLSEQRAQLTQFEEAIWASRASGAVQATLGPELLIVPGGQALVLHGSALGFALGAGFDAVGQVIHSGEVRPMQTLVAGATGAVVVPAGAAVMRQGAGWGAQGPWRWSRWAPRRGGSMRGL